MLKNGGLGCRVLTCLLGHPFHFKVLVQVFLDLVEVMTAFSRPVCCLLLYDAVCVGSHDSFHVKLGECKRDDGG